MTSPATKTIKVTSGDHRDLKVIAAKSGEPVYKVIARLVRAAKNGYFERTIKSNKAKGGVR